MPTDPFSQNADSATAPSAAPYAVTPNDSTALPVVPKALYIGGAGDLVVRGVAASADVTFRNIGAGQIIDVRAIYVRATGTTATNIVALA